MAKSIPVYEMNLYHIDFDGDQIIPRDGKPFPREAYSLYKYGSSDIGRQFGYQLAAKFTQEYPDIVKSPNLMLTGSAYKYVQTGSTSIAKPFLGYINQQRYRLGLPSSHLVKIERTTIYSGDYGSFPLSLREKLMQRNHLHLDKDFLHGADLVVTDDIRVTGIHQGSVLKFAEELELRSVGFLYVIGIVDREAANRDPKIEDRINHTVVKHLKDLIPIVSARDFVFNARVCKFLLNPKNRTDLLAFLEKMEDWFVLELFNNCIGDGYCSMKEYIPSFLIIEQILKERSNTFQVS